MITVPHPDIYWAYNFLKVTVFKVYHSCTKEGETVQISHSISISDAFGKAYLCHLKRLLFLKYSQTI